MVLTPLVSITGAGFLFGADHPAPSMAGDYEVGNVEYAVEHLGARFSIRPAVLTARGAAGDQLINSTKSNADEVAAQIRRKAHLGALKAETRVVEAYYDFDTGKVKWLERRQ